MLLTNKVALITGSGRGIGRAMALLFAREGAAVFLTARTEKELAGVAEEIAAQGGKASYACGDLTLTKDAERVFAETEKKFGRVDILVNNAGHYGPVVPVEDYPLEEFDKVNCSAPARGVSAQQIGAAGNVRAEIGGDPEYFELVRKGSVFVGVGICGGEGGLARADALHGR